MPSKKTKIIATIGPSANSEEKVERLIKAGVNVFRFNFSHGNYEEHKQKFDWVNKLKSKYPVAILADLGGPKIRIGKIKDKKIVLRRGQEFILTTEKIIGNDEIVYASIEGIIDSLRIGDRILLADGSVELIVKDKRDKEVITRVRIGGVVSEGKGVNIPSEHLDIEVITEKDKKDLAFALRNGADAIAMSFVRNSEDILKLKELIEKEGKTAPVIAKIERKEAIENFEEILSACDGIMIARGDLGVEIPFQKIPVVQKKLIYISRQSYKPVITATQMLKSLLENPLPTRAEITDVANAVLDGSDALMLSEETAVASNPVKSVEIMVKIIKEAEKLKGEIPIPFKAKKDVECEIAHAAFKFTITLGAKAIITPTSSGATARRVSSLRPHVPILAITENIQVYNFLNFSFGVHPVFVEKLNDLNQVVILGKKYLKEKKLAKDGDYIVITGGFPFGKPGTTNLVKVEKI